jgi:hypothetical protein
VSGSADGRRKVHQAIVVRPVSEVIEQEEAEGEVGWLACLERREDLVR